MDFFDRYMTTLFKHSHFNKTKQIILQKLLQQCADTIRIRLIWYNMDKKLCIHSHNMLKIDLKWNNFIQANVKLLPEELNLYKLMKSELFIDLTDVQKFINIFINKNEMGFLRELLGIDGFLTQNPLKYVENLKIGDEGSDHVHVIRKIYRELKSLHVEVIYSSLLKIYLNFAKDDEIIQLLINTIKSLPSSQNNDESKIITTIYTSHILDLETTALTKIAHLKLLKKKMNRPTTTKKKRISHCSKDLV